MDKKIVTCMAVIVLILGFSNQAYATNHNTSIFSNAQLYANSNIYKNQNYGFSIQPPTSWSALNNLPSNISDQALVIFSNNDNNQLATFGIYHRNINQDVINAINANSDNDILATVSQEMSSPKTDSKTIVSHGVVDRYDDGTKITISSTTQYTANNSVVSSESIIYFLNNGNQYTLDLTSNSGNFDKNSQLFEESANTFLVSQNNPTRSQTMPITVNTDKSSYTLGDTIMISGSVQSVIPGTPLVIQIFDSANNLVQVAQIDVSADGTYIDTIKAVGVLWKLSGAYTVEVQYGPPSVSAQTSFTFQNSIVSTNDIFQLKSPTSQQVFNIAYTISGGTVKTMAVDSQSESLIVSIESTSDGVITLQLPRSLIDAKKTSGQDDAFIILIDGAEIKPQSETANNNFRNISIPFLNGDRDIEIIGTVLLPSSSSSPPTTVPAPQVSNTPPPKTTAPAVTPSNTVSNTAVTPSNPDYTFVVIIMAVIAAAVVSVVVVILVRKRKPTTTPITRTDDTQIY